MTRRSAVLAAGALAAVLVVLVGATGGGRSAAATGPSVTLVPSEPEAALAHADEIAATQGLSRYAFVEVHFGNIPVELTMYARDEAEASAAAQAAFARVAELSAMMDDYALEPPSLLNRIAAESPAAVGVPPELLGALERAMAHHRFTDGAFDITAKPYVQLWRVARRIGELPPADRLRDAARFVGIEALELDREAATARLTREGMWLDLGGLAKGLVGDEVVRLLGERGVSICRYHAGGDMVFGDAPPGLPGWPVHVPDLRIGGVALAFWERNAAASVSGDLFRFVEIGGLRYAHVIDPRTGLGVTGRRIACVRGRRGVDTDPLATAGLILDEEVWRAALDRVSGCGGWVARVGDGR